MSTVAFARPATKPWRGWRLPWLILGVPAFAAGWASAQTMGEVVGEAWGGDFLHQLGHAIGSVVLMALVSVAGWLALRRQVSWAFRWAVATTLGSVVGLAVVMPVLVVAPPSMVELTIAFTLFIPLAASAAARPGRCAGNLRIRCGEEWRGV